MFASSRVRGNVRSFASQLSGHLASDLGNLLLGVVEMMPFLNPQVGYDDLNVGPELRRLESLLYALDRAAVNGNANSGLTGVLDEAGELGSHADGTVHAALTELIKGFGCLIGDLTDVGSAGAGEKHDALG